MSSVVRAWRVGYERMRKEFESNRRLELYHLRFQPVGDAVELPNRWREAFEAAEFRRESVWQPGCPDLPTYEHPQRAVLHGSRTAAELFDRLATEVWQAVPGSPDGKTQAAVFAGNDTDRWLTLVYRQLSNAQAQGLNYLEQDDWVVIRQEGEEPIEPAERYALPWTYGPIRDPDPRPQLTLPFDRWRVTRPTVDLFTASVIALDLLLADPDPEGTRLNSWQELDAWQRSPAFQNANHELDSFILGNGGRFPIYRNSCRVIPGKFPSVCPKARPSLPPEFLPEVAKVFRHFLGEGQTVHWVGDQATIESVCTCRTEGTPTDDQRAETPSQLIPPEATAVLPDQFRYGERVVEELSRSQWKLLDALCEQGHLRDAVPLPEVVSRVYKVDQKREAQVREKLRALQELRRRVQDKLDKAGLPLLIDWTNETLRLQPTQ